MTTYNPKPCSHPGCNAPATCTFTRLTCELCHAHVHAPPGAQLRPATADETALSTSKRVGS